MIALFHAAFSPVNLRAATTITVGGDQGATVAAPAPDAMVAPTDPVAPATDPTLPSTDATAAPVDTAVQPADTTKTKGTDKTATTAFASATAASSVSEGASDPSRSLAGPTSNTLLFTGAATTSLPIAVPPGRLGISPALALSYNSYQQNGWLGVGWGLDLGAIQRSTKKGVHYNDTGSYDFVVTSNGVTTELVPRSEWGTNYFGAKIEGEFTKYYHDTTNDLWVVYGKDGTTYYFGKTPYDATLDGRQDNILGVFKWCLVWVQDANGNYMKVSYTKDQGEIYLDQIEYTGNGTLAPSNMVKFTSLPRPVDDAPVLYTTNAAVTMAKRLTTIEVKAKNSAGVYQLARKYTLDYDDTISSSRRSLLKSITTFDCNGAKPFTTTLSSYTAAQHFTTLSDSGLIGKFGADGSAGGWSNDNQYPRYLADVNGDGKADIVGFSSYGVSVALSNGTSFTPQKDPWIQGFGTEAGGWSSNSKYPRYMADVNGDGKADIVGFADAGVVVALSTGTSFVADKDPWVTAYGTNAEWTDTNTHPRYVVDINGDGKADIVGFSNVRVKISRSTGSSFTTSTSAIPEFGEWQGWPNNLTTPRYLADVNGDGKPDIVGFSAYGVKVSLGTGSSFTASEDWLPNAYGTQAGGWSSNSKYPRYMADVNGDGKADIVGFADAGVVVALSTGSSFVASPTPWIFGYGTNQGWADTDKYPRYVTDVNGDGKADIVGFASSGVKVALSTGSSFIDSPAPWVNGYGHDSGWSNSYYPRSMADINGDGKPDIVGFAGAGVVASIADPTPQDLLKTITSFTHSSSTFTYQPSSAYANILLPFVVQTVASITTNDGFEDLPPTSYSYSGGYFSFTEREFRGFSTVTQANPDDTKVVTRFCQDQWRKGRQFQVTAMDSSPAHASLGSTYFTWEYPTTNPGWAFIKLNKKRTNLIENGVTTSFTQEDYAYFNDTGYLNSITTSGTEVETVTTTTTYWQSPGLWLWRPDSITVTDSTGVQVRNTTTGYESGTGNMKWQERWLKDGTNPRTEILSYDLGNPKEVKDARGYVTTTEYDTLTHTYPVRVNYPATTDNPLGIVTIHSTETGNYDYRFGVPRWSSDENGNQTSYTYDTFGRLIQVDAPDGGQTVTIFDDHLTPFEEQPLPRDIMTKVKEDSAGHTIIKHAYFDGLGRPIQTTNYGEGGKLIVATITYDDMGRVSQSDGPFFPTSTGEAPPNHPWVRTLYDDRGRPETISGPNSSGGIATTTFSYSGLSTTMTDPDAMKKTEQKDALGRLIKVIEYDGTTKYSTGYTYSATGELSTVTDALGNKTILTYDTLGRKISIKDPDMGIYAAWGYTYDQNGNLQTQTDGKGQTVTFTYDELNRPMTKSYTFGDPTVTYSYDDSDINNGLGHLYMITNGLVTNRFMSYDAMGRVKSAAKIITGNTTTYTTQTAYDQSGKVTKQTYPDGYAVNYAYYPGSGLLKTVTGSDGVVYATYSNYEPTGKIGRIDHQNGTKSIHIYDPASTRLINLVTNNPANGNLQNRLYTYSPAGDVLSIADQMTGNTYRYTYDSMHRLKTESENGLPAEVSYEYSRIGNITNKTVGTDTVIYTYAGSRKHAVSKVTVNGVDKNFGYDPNGNQTIGFDFTNLSSIVMRKISYNGDNMPLSITRGTATTTLTYDSSGTRAKKVSPSGTIYYYGEHYEIENNVPTKYILANGERIAKVTPSDTSYFHKDHLGSATLVTTASNAIPTESTEYMPFGEMRSHSGTTTSNYKFTGQELDPETGLYNYRARLYDPVLGRFMSADTVVPNYRDPQSLNRYSYCRNNPLRYVDPSGHSFFSAIVGAIIGGVNAAIHGDNIFKGVVTGAISGAIFNFAGDLGGGVLRHTIAGVVSGGINAGITGGDVGLGSLVGGISGGIGNYFGNYLPDEFGIQLAGRSVIGGVTGGIGAEIYGGHFSDGFRQGTITAAYGYLLNECLHGGATCVRALRGGTVVRSGWQNANDHTRGGGWRVTVQESDGSTTMYGHLTPDETPPVGTALNVDSEIANYADPSNGHSSAPHVHVQTWNQNGQLVAPGGLSPIENGVLRGPYQQIDSWHPHGHHGEDYVAP